MTDAQQNRGGAPVGYLTELDSIEAASVIYLRLWCAGPDAQSQVCNDLVTCLGPEKGQKSLESFQTLCSLCARHGRRPLMRHAVHCKYLGADEACFANFISTAATGDRDDAMLIATLIVRADVAPLLTSVAADFGLALRRMRLSAPRELANDTQVHTLH